MLRSFHQPLGPPSRVLCQPPSRNPLSASIIFFHAFFRELSIVIILCDIRLSACSASPGHLFDQLICQLLFVVSCSAPTLCQPPSLQPYLLSATNVYQHPRYLECLTVSFVSPFCDTPFTSSRHLLSRLSLVPANPSRSS